MKEEMMFFYPCKKDSSRVSLDVNLLKPINFEALFEKVTTMPQKYKYPQFSEELGLTKFSHGRTEIMVFKNGRMKIQNCKDKEEAKFILGEIEALI